jgi:hypothetical protein
VAIVFALPYLFDRVAARFAAEGTDVPMAFGWQAASEQMRTSRRITWIPGDEGDGLGALSAAKFPGQAVRTIATLNELCTVLIEAFDDVERSDERRQYQAVRELFDAWLRAVYLEARGTYQIMTAKWVGGDRARRAGAALRIIFAIQAPVFDGAIGVETVDVERASIDGNQIETIDVTRGDTP